MFIFFYINKISQLCNFEKVNDVFHKVRWILLYYIWMFPLLLMLLIFGAKDIEKRIKVPIFLADTNLFNE